MANYDYDLFVIGAGSGGVRAARMAASQYGKRVGIAENMRLGGTCVMRGCVPKKLMVYASHFSHDFEDASAYGWTVIPPTFDWPTLVTNKNTELNRLESVYEGLLSSAGVETINGRGRLIDSHTVEVKNVGGAARRVTAETILIATGGWPSVPSIPGIEHAITSNEALDLPTLPRRIIIVGGGYIAVEFAGIFNGVGADVSLVIRGDKILRGFDEDVRDTLQDEMQKAGIAIKAGSAGAKIEKTAAGYDLTLENGDVLQADTVMYATGRAPNTKGIGLEDAGVEMDRKGAIVVDPYSKTNVESIYAIGDVTDRMALTPVAIAEAMALLRTLYDKTPTAMDYTNIPTAVFSQPPIGTVGMTEEQAAVDHDVEVYVSRFRPMKYTLSGRDEKTLMKMIVDKKTDKVLGVHMVGVDAGEIAQGLGIALKAGATKAVFDSTVGIHPTAAEEFVTMRTPRG